MSQIEYYKIFSKAFPFWNKLTEDDKKSFCRHTVAIKYEIGEIIHGGNQECTGCIIVQTGCLRVYILSENGKEITLYRLYPGDICILSASCVLKSINFDVFIDVEEECEAFIVNGSFFKKIADRNIYVENFALNSAVQRFSDVMWVMQQILFMSFNKRLAIFLYDEMIKTNTDDIKLTHEQIAKYMGSAREVVSRMLKYFVSENIVELYRGEIKIIDKDKLHNLIV